MAPARFERFFAQAPAELDVEAIQRQWQALAPGYRVDERSLPLPLWARRGLGDGGAAAWQALCREASLGDESTPYCIYIHIPFCAGRCGFCDCYSYPLRRHRAEHLQRYLALLEREMALWGTLGGLARRPVSTVHLGGGTPTLLDAGALARLVARVRAHYRARETCEWALESTTTELDAGMIEALAALGFTRLHVGVQSLADGVRRRIGRREPGAEVLAKIGRAVAMGWVVSVDLILGLPGQTLPGLLDDIRRLAEGGVEGFSLYELQRSRRNAEFCRRHGLLERDRLGDYWLLLAASQWLEALGYRKTLFNHYARARDTNLYFTFPERGEDCLALGTIGDGVLGEYHYRHLELRDYGRSVGQGLAGLQGGLRRSALESRARRLETALLSGSIVPELLEAELGAPSAAALLGAWRESALVEGDPARPGRLRLTGNGSWFCGPMIDEVRAALR